MQRFCLWLLLAVLPAIVAAAPPTKTVSLPGGSWFNEPEALRTANRHRHPVDSRQANLGLRVLWLPDSKRPKGP